jgi:hypothetical protein
MWSGIAREDRYVNGRWQTPGNLFTQNYYDENYINNYVDIRGCILRDMALFSMTRGFLKSLNVDFYMLNMMPFNFLQLDRYYNKDSNADIFYHYRETLSTIKPDLATVVLNNEWPSRPIYHNPGQTVDYHPSTKQHLEYLQKVLPDVKFTDTTIEFVNHYEDMINNATHINDITWRLNKPKRF